MQRLRSELQGSHAAAPLFDSDAVRRVLARVSEIETQAENELLSVSQVEALGAELGLSPQAVRRALGETVGSSSETGLTTKNQSVQSRTSLT